MVITASALSMVLSLQLTNVREAAVEDAAFVSCWMLPIADSDVIEILSIDDTVSLQAMEATANGPDTAEVAQCPGETLGPYSAAE